MSNKWIAIVVAGWLSGAGTALAGGACEAYAAENKKAEEAIPCDRYKIGTAVYGIISLMERNIQISEACRSKATGALKCDAFEALKNASFKGVLETYHGGMNPGSPVCEKLGGQVVIGEHRVNHAEYSFCHFKDGTMVDSGTLQFYARQNDLYEATHGK